MLFKYICILCLLLQMCSWTDSSNILGLFTSNHRSHMLVYIGVIKGLVKRGHNITIVTVLPVQDMLPRDIRIVQLKKPPEPEPMRGIFRQIAVVAAYSRTFEDSHFREFLEEDNQFDLVILGYLFNDYQLGVAAHFNCPIIVIWTTQPISFVNRFVGNPNGWSYVPHPFVRSQTTGLRGVLFGIFETIFKWVLDFIMDKAYREFFPSSKYPNLEEMRKNVSMVLCNHHFSEGPISANLPSMVEISGIQIEENQNLPKALKDYMDSAEHGVIYFSLGTVVSPKQINTANLYHFFKIFSSLPQKIIWKIESFPKNSSNVYTGKWFPQSAILAHRNIKLFITHGGKGSMTEALYYGVPMIVIPIFGDQFADAHRLEKNGFGLRLETRSMTERSIGDRISEVLNNDTYSQNIRIASEIYKDRPFSPEETVTYWIEYVIRHRGASHMQTPIKYMNIFQYLNLDVYLFLVSFLYVVLRISILIELFKNLPKMKHTYTVL